MKNKSFVRALGLYISGCMLILLFASCHRAVTITVTNPLNFDRLNEMVEVPNPFSSASVCVTDEAEHIIPHQLTYEGNVLFPVDIRAHEVKHYVIRRGENRVDTLTSGGLDAAHRDQLVWRNAQAVFTAYAADAEGRPASGYGIGGRAADATLGGGEAALVENDTLLYPQGYTGVKVLENGPLRFTAELRYAPRDIDGDTTVIEMRRIELDAGAPFCRTVVYFKNLTHSLPLQAGLTIRDHSGEILVDTASRYVAYSDTLASEQEGPLFQGIVTIDSLDQAGPVYFCDRELPLHGGALGHVMAIDRYSPHSDYTYYWGYAGKQAGITSMAEWKVYLDRFVARLKEPLMVSYEWD